MIWQNLHEANRCHRCAGDACHCFLHYVIGQRGGGRGGRLFGLLPAGSDILSINSRNNNNNNNNNNNCVLFAGLAEAVSRSSVNALGRIVFEVFLHS